MELVLPMDCDGKNTLKEKKTPSHPLSLGMSYRKREREKEGVRREIACCN